MLAQNVVPHMRNVTASAEPCGNHNWKWTVEWTVRAFGFMGLDELSSRYKLTHLLIILATILNFLNNILQNPTPGL